MKSTKRTTPTQHTPTPWTMPDGYTLEKSGPPRAGGIRTYYIYNPMGQLMMVIGVDDNDIRGNDMAFILEAVNAHDANQATINALANALTEILYAPASSHIEPELYENAEAALALARGEK